MKRSSAIAYVHLAYANILSFEKEDQQLERLTVELKESLIPGTKLLGKHVVKNNEFSLQSLLETCVEYKFVHGSYMVSTVWMVL